MVKSGNFKQPEILQLIRLESVIEFNCLRCGKVKKSKVYAICDNNNSARVCNGCYGNMLANNKSKTD